jgi:hypothetical protein
MALTCALLNPALVVQDVKCDEITTLPRGASKVLGFVSRYLILRGYYLTIDNLGH